MWAREKGENAKKNEIFILFMLLSASYYTSFIDDGIVRKKDLIKRDAADMAGKPYIKK